MEPQPCLCLCCVSAVPVSQPCLEPQPCLCCVSAVPVPCREVLEWIVNTVLFVYVGIVVALEIMADSVGGEGGCTCMCVCVSVGEGGSSWQTRWVGRGGALVCVSVCVSVCVWGGGDLALAPSPPPLPTFYVGFCPL